MTENEFNARFLCARIKVIENEFMNLNAEQRRAVMATEGPLLILAGAGSGKTTVLINRILNLIRFGRGSDSFDIPEDVSEEDLRLIEAYADSKEQSLRDKALNLCALDSVRPYNIIAITFTNKAAGELKERLSRALGSEANDVWASTFHSACMRILRSGIDRLGYAANFTIYDTADSERVIKDIEKSLDIDEKNFPPRTVLNVISSAKDQLLTPLAFAKMYKDSTDFRMIKIADIYSEYAKRLREANALDFDDIILNTVILLREHDDIREYYQNKFKYVLIDEYQDTNNLQYMLSKLLAGNGNICVVGDDDQSIYKFRGATIENILSFEKQYENVRVIRLEQNYRSTKNILDCSNCVIKNNAGRKGKELWTDKETGNTVKIFTGEDENGEAEYIAGKILDGYTKTKRWNDFAVLYRMNAQSNRIEEAFKRNGIPYRVVGGIKFFERMEVKDMLAYLCIINNPADDLRLKRIINTPARGIGDKSIEAIEDIAAHDGITMFEVIKNSSKYPVLQRLNTKLSAFAAMLEELSAMLNFLPLSEFYEEVIKKTGYLKPFEIKNDIESRGRIENVMELLTSVKNYEARAETPELSGFLEEIALYTDLDNLDPDADAAVMMTIHSAKGLEFDTVFVTGLEEGIFPGLRAISEHDELEEERRLCYVAMTRAKHELHLTRAARRMLFGQTRINPVSRFIKEIPPEYTDEHNENQSDSKIHYIDKPKRAQTPAVKIPPVIKPDVKINFNKGDIVKHKTFGRGMVQSVIPMGGDAMIEIAFDGIGLKRLMAKSASAYISPEK